MLLGRFPMHGKITIYVQSDVTVTTETKEKTQTNKVFNAA